MSTELIINASLPEVRIAQMENGEIQDLLIERASGKGIVGNIYKGRVTRVLPGMQAAFVDIGLEKAAFLYVDDVFVHPEIWEEEERAGETRRSREDIQPVAALPREGAEGSEPAPEAHAGEGQPTILPVGKASAEGAPYDLDEDEEDLDGEGFEEFDVPAARPDADEDEDEDDDEDEGDDEDDDEDEGDEDDDEDEGDDEGEARMSGGPERPDGTTGPGEGSGGGGESQGQGGSGGESGGGGEGSSSGSSSGSSDGGSSAGGAPGAGSGDDRGEGGKRRRHRRGRRGGRNRRDREGQGPGPVQGHRPSGSPIVVRDAQAGPAESSGDLPGTFSDQMADPGVPSSDRSTLDGATGEEQITSARNQARAEGQGQQAGNRRERPEFKQSRGRDKRIKSRPSSGRERAHAQIQDLLKEGQEVIVQVAKDPISTKGARLTCHISLPGRHLVCMPTIDHVGVSRRIERDEERRRLRDFVEKNRPKNLGFIVRTASGRGQAERRIGQDIDYLVRLWGEIREKAAQVTAPALVYEDLNSVLRVIRDWVTEDIDKIVVDSRYHYNEIQRFVSHFMPSLKQKVELYQGDLPIFDTFGISTELARALERKVWLKSGGYIVIDQAEALVAVDVNTGRYVGKKNLEDTILKTNLEAVQEIAYQLRLRNCGGIIILDLIDMEREENKMQVYRALEEALKRDRARPSILKISELGLVEMTRKRTRDTIVRALCDSCTHCEGKGFVKSKVTVAYEIMREVEREGVDREIQKILVQAHPDVVDVLAIDERDTIDQLERRYRKQVFLQSIGDYHPEQFEVSSDRQTERKAADSFDRSRNRDRARRGRGRDGERQAKGGSGSGGSGGSGGGGRDRDRGRGRDRDRDRDRDKDRGRDRGDRDRGRGRDDQGGGPGGEAQFIESAPRAIVEPRQPQMPPEDMNEEDRLAFLRAQAAQDAAITTGSQRDAGSGQAQGDRAPGGPGGDRDREGGRSRRRRGRRGGRFRRGRDERKADGSQPREGGAPEGGSSSGGGSGEGGGDGGGEGGGGGSDHSQPPVT